MPTTNVNFAFSRLKQTNYATARAYASGAYVRSVTTDETPFDFDNQWEDNAGQAIGSNEATDMWRTMNDAKKSFPINLSFQEIGYWLLGALGAVATTGSAAPYTHVFTPQDLNVSHQLPVRTILQEYPNLKKYLVPSALVKSLKISRSKAGGYLNAVAEVIGSGKYEINPSGYTMPDLPENQTYAWSNQVTLSVEDTVESETQNYSCEIEDATLTIENETKDAEGYRACSEFQDAANPKSGIYRAELLTVKRKYMLDFKVRLESGDKMQTFLNAGNDVSFTFPIDNDVEGHSLIFTATKARIINCKETKDGDFIVTTGQIQVLSDGTGILPFEAELINDVASYLT